MKSAAAQNPTLRMMSDEQLVYLLGFLAQPVIDELRERGCEIDFLSGVIAGPGGSLFHVSRDGHDIEPARFKDPVS